MGQIFTDVSDSIPMVSWSAISSGPSLAWCGSVGERGELEEIETQVLHGWTMAVLPGRWDWWDIASISGVAA